MNFLSKKIIIEKVKSLKYYDIIKETASKDFFGIPTIAQINLKTGKLEFIHKEEADGLLLFKINSDEGIEDLDNLSSDELKALNLENVTHEDIYISYADDMTFYSNDFDWEEINKNLEKIYK